MAIRSKGVSKETQVVYTKDPTPEEMSEIIGEMIDQIRLNDSLGNDGRVQRLRQYLRVIAHLAHSNDVRLPNLSFKPVVSASAHNA